MVAFNRNFGFPQQPQIGRGLVNPRSSSLRPGNSPVMPRTTIVGKLIGESPKTGGVDNKPNENETMSKHYFDSVEDFDKAVRDGRIKDGDEVTYKYVTEDGTVLYNKGTYNTKNCVWNSDKWYKDKDCTIPYTG